MVVQLPNERTVVIDAKTSTAAFHKPARRPATPPSRTPSTDEDRQVAVHLAKQVDWPGRNADGAGDDALIRPTDGMAQRYVGGLTPGRPSMANVRLLYTLRPGECYAVLADGRLERRRLLPFKGETLMWLKRLNLPFSCKFRANSC